MKRNQVVKDEAGNHFLYLRKTKEGDALCESVATRELFAIPFAELSETDRVAF